MNLDLKGKRVLITGASKGIGLSTAWAFAREGCDLYLTARSADQLQANSEAIARECNVSVTTHPVDMGDSEQVGKLAERFSDADILVNNAGDIPAGNLASVSEEAWRNGWNVKVYGYINLTRHLYPRMVERRSGVIVNDIGNSGENWDANYIAGASGNASLMAFTRGLGGVSLDHGVRVVGVNPGPVATDRMVKMMKKRATEWHGDESRWEELHDKYPGKRPATPEEVADLIVFLASPRAGYITGTIVTIDGGIASRRSII
ncbi:SDR family oxidoreductase [Bradyrhizobium sp. NP1]|jgi:NAD(P)-dependent dehydrogenase (short-subunit alcohol dehydrogenase family)|uniref:SDR family oxidoreductase n=1 Tax=Bradyrhizobium sp. NP1 TaxID=3049772 RepID=UPI0025A61243|nr:SDR family oxidoreductase [Bradyrhizobium sp. NP1]WJR80854.1 SDR family oxidoreductase [Bradyrhizobium sp. NP1]